MDDQEPKLRSNQNLFELVKQEAKNVWDHLLNTLVLQGEGLKDAFIESELLRDIPILGQVVAAGRSVISIKDLLFLNKVKTFLDGMTPSQEQKLKEKLRSNEEYKRKFAIKLMLLLERSSDMEKAELLAKIVSAYAEDQIDTTVMDRLFDSVDRLFVQDLQVLKAFYNFDGDLSDFIAGNYESLQGLAMSGLVGMALQDGSQWQYDGDRFNPNRSGEILVKILQEGIPPRRKHQSLGKHRR